jgi:hypothetical protein
MARITVLTCIPRQEEIAVTFIRFQRIKEENGKRKPANAYFRNTPKKEEKGLRPRVSSRRQ